MIAALNLAALAALAVAVPSCLVLAFWMLLAAINHDLARDQRDSYTIRPHHLRRRPKWLRGIGGGR